MAGGGEGERERERKREREKERKRDKKEELPVDYVLKSVSFCRYLSTMMW